MMRERETKITNSEILCISIIIFIALFSMTNIGGFSVLILLFPIIYRKKILIKYGYMGGICVAYFVYLSFITIINANNLYDAENARNYIIEFGIALVSLTAFYWAEPKKILQVFRNMGIFLCMFGVLESILKRPILQLAGSGWQDIGENGYRIQLIFSRSIICGTMLLLFWTALYFFPLKRKWLNLLAEILIIYNILVNQTRSVWIAFVCELVIIYLLKPNKKTISNKYFIFAGVFILGIIVLNFLGYDLLGYMYNYISTRIIGSLQAGEGKIVRLETVISSLKYWFLEGNLLRFILGGGKNYDKIFLSIHPVIKGNGAFIWTGAIDNQFFTCIHECGIIGLLILTKILTKAISRLRKCNTNNTVGKFANIALIGILVCYFFYEGFNYIMTLWIFMMLATLSDISVKEENK